MGPDTHESSDSSVSNPDDNIHVGMETSSLTDLDIDGLVPESSEESPDEGWHSHDRKVLQARLWASLLALVRRWRLSRHRPTLSLPRRT